MSDPRTTLARPDIADAVLEGRVAAAAYAVPTRMRCTAPFSALHAAPDPLSEQPDQLLFGEAFDVLAADGGWAWGQARRDGYVGHVRREALAPWTLEPTHRVAALRAAALTAPDLKAPPAGLFGLNALITVEARQGRFVRAGGAGWLIEAQLSPVGMFETDAASVAERFVGAPYVWGGRDSTGVDCSGLVQQALHACGRSCPRDTDQQLAALGQPIDGAALRRGDLVFWTGHVAMMLDGTRLIHASGDHGCTAIETLDATLARIGPVRGPPVGLRRL